jgi:nicotinamide-nucleotide amidase
MPSAEIISIGTELLLGEIVDTNARFIAQLLRDSGIDLYRKSTIGDNPTRIAATIQEGLARADIIITTGGLGPTIDDATREAVALATEREIEYRPELWDQILARFKRYNRQPTENNKRQAYIPQGSIPIENPVGTAPSFIVEVGDKAIISLPGVPREMEHLMHTEVIPYLKDHYKISTVFKIRILRTASIGESQIDDSISELEKLANPTVGLSAHSGQVDIRITAKADSLAEADSLIAPIEDTIHQRLGEWIFGADKDTLEGNALSKIDKHQWRLFVCEYGLDGALISRLAGHGEPFMGGEMLVQSPAGDERLPFTARRQHEQGSDVVLGIFLYPSEEKQDIYLTLITPEGSQEVYRPYGGAPGNAPRFAVNIGLDMLRKL